VTMSLYAAIAIGRDGTDNSFYMSDIAYDIGRSYLAPALARLSSPKSGRDFCSSICHCEERSDVAISPLSFPRRRESIPFSKASCPL